MVIEKNLAEIIQNIDSPLSKTFLKLEKLSANSILKLSSKDWHFQVVNGKKKETVKMFKFINTYFPNKFEKDEVISFCEKIIHNSKPKHVSTKIEVRPFVYEPLNVRDTFLSLVTETYPHGFEEDVVKYLPQDLEIDDFGNYYKIIGNSETVFTSHLDTALREKSGVELYSFFVKNQEFIQTDETTILGADDKAGVTIMLYMMANNVPGLYYFFLGEERGGIGSRKVVNEIIDNPLFKGKKRMVSFDRRNYYSIITSQLGEACCSSDFADSLCNELNKNGLIMKPDDTGIFTDSANFIDFIPECTNVSVGYFNEHTHKEIQNISYLETLCKCLVDVDWENLPTIRKAGISEESIAKHGEKIKKLRKLGMKNTLHIKEIKGNLYTILEVDNKNPMGIYEDLSLLRETLGSIDIKFINSNILIKL